MAAEPRPSLPSITLEYGNLRCSITKEEASLLRDWVSLETTAAGVRLTGLVDAVSNAIVQSPIVLDKELRRALCNALDDEEFDDHPGLASLHDLCIGIHSIP